MGLGDGMCWCLGEAVGVVRDEEEVRSVEDLRELLPRSSRSDPMRRRLGWGEGGAEVLRFSSSIFFFESFLPAMSVNSV